MFDSSEWEGLGGRFDGHAGGDGRDARYVDRGLDRTERKRRIRRQAGEVK